MDRIEGTEKKVSSALSIKISSQMESNFIHSFIHFELLKATCVPGTEQSTLQIVLIDSFKQHFEVVLLLSPLTNEENEAQGVLVTCS